MSTEVRRNVTQGRGQEVPVTAVLGGRFSCYAGHCVMKFNPALVKRGSLTSEVAEQAASNKAVPSWYNDWQRLVL